MNHMYDFTHSCSLFGHLILHALYLANLVRFLHLKIMNNDAQIKQSDFLGVCSYPRKQSEHPPVYGRDSIKPLSCRLFPFLKYNSQVYFAVSGRCWPLFTIQFDIHQY